MGIGDAVVFILLYVTLLTYSTLCDHKAGWGRWIIFALLMITMFVGFFRG